MYLMPMHDFVEKTSKAISNILGVDVVIVDSNYNRIGNTFSYPGEPIPIRRMSVMGQIIESGKPAMMDKKETYASCKNCPDITTCSISAMLGVPILFQSKVVGAIALIIPPAKKISVFNNLGNTINFLENMADLLSGKIQNYYDYQSLNRIRKERESLMDCLDDALVTTDHLGNITYSNKAFRIIFADGAANLVGNITEYISHHLIRESLTHCDGYQNKLFYYKTDTQDFYGFVSCQHLFWDSLPQGTLFHFRNIRKLESLNRPVGRTSITFSQITCQGDSVMKRLVADAKSLAVTNEIITITGERCINKNAFAWAIHNFSNRSDKLFTQINCYDMTLESREDEIIGSVDSNNMVESLGKLWIAYQGTIYFNDIDALPLFLQDQLVSFIKTGSIRLNSQSDIPADTRILCSSAKDLKELTAAGLFREELYYRICKNELVLPPLRERPKDVEYLFRTYVSFFGKRIASTDMEITPDAVELLLSYAWPGNLAELQQAAEHSVLHATGNQITSHSLYIPERNATSKTVARSIDDIERNHMIGLLETHKNKNEVASLLGISRATLYRKIKKYGLLVEDRSNNF